MSNHHHVVLTDVEGRIPEFTRELHRMTAKALNALQDQCENLWSAEPSHLLELGDDADVVAKIAYLAANPVVAGLVQSPDEWPGLLRLPRAQAQRECVARPTVFFSRTGVCPPEIELSVDPPDGIADVEDRVAAATELRVLEARAEMRRKGCEFLGREKVMATSFASHAQSSEKQRGIIPRVAARSMFLRIALLAAHREFLRDYHRCVEKWCSGIRSVIFPLGTWWMRVFHGACTWAEVPAGATTDPIAAPS